MAVLIGGIAPFPGANNNIVGTGLRDVVFGDPFDAGDGSGRRTRRALDEATERIQKELTAHLENARRLTGR